MIAMTTQSTIFICDYCEESTIERNVITDHRRNLTYERPENWLEKCGWETTKNYAFCSRCTNNHNTTHLRRTARRKAEERRTTKQEKP